MAVSELGLTEAQFWRMTPALFFECCELRNASIKREDYRAAVLTLVVRKVVGDKKADLWDFFPSYEDDDDRPQRANINAIRANMAALRAARKKG